MQPFLLQYLPQSIGGFYFIVSNHPFLVLSYFTGLWEGLTFCSVTKWFHIFLSLYSFIVQTVIDIVQGAEVVRMYKTLLGSQGFRKVSSYQHSRNPLWEKNSVHGSSPFPLSQHQWISFVFQLSGHGSLLSTAWWASCNLWRLLCCNARCK